MVHFSITKWYTFELPYTSELYGYLFNEAYRLCKDVLITPVPETKVARFAKQAATWKFKDLKDDNGNTVNIVPNVTDLIESYHILCMANAILIFANDQKGSIDRFLVSLSLYNDKGLDYCLYHHCFEPYIEPYKKIIFQTIFSCANLRPGYNYKEKDEYLRKNIPWFRKMAIEYEQLINEVVQKDKTNIKEQNNNNCIQFFGPVINSTLNMQDVSSSTPKKTKSSAQKKKNIEKLNVHPKTLKYYKHGNKGVLAQQQKRVDIVFEMWNRWNWISGETSTEDFNHLFEGEPRHCNIKWKDNTTIISILIKELLNQKFIEKQKGQFATSMVKEQFGLTPNFERKRLSEDELFKIHVSIYVLDIENPLVSRKSSTDNNYDTSDEAFKMLLSGEFHSSKHT